MTNYADAVERATTRLDATGIDDLGRLDWAGQRQLDWIAEPQLEWAPEADVEAEVEADADSLLRTVTSDDTILDEPPGLEDLHGVGVLPDGLAITDSQRAMLDFERTWWRNPGAKEQAIRDQFSLSPTRYYQALNALLELPDALRYDPALVNRLRRLRTGRLRGRRTD